MRIIITFAVLTLLIVGSIYIFLQKPAPQKYLDLIAKTESIKTVKYPIKILFVGDIMLDRSIRKVIEEKGFNYVVGDIVSIFKNKDLIIGNLEGAITDNESISAKNNKILRFTFATSTAGELKMLGFDGFSLSNNHTLDFYQTGFDETKSNLDTVGLFYFGHPLNNQNLSSIQMVNDENICFVGYHSLYNATSSYVVNEIVKLKATCDFLTVVSHWGEEYEDFENEEQRKSAHLFIDNGADLVVGHHPHVIQPIEIYKDKVIFYSLGNFIFDQDFSLSTRQGIAIELTLDENNQKFKIIPIEMYKGKLYFPEKDVFKPRIDILSSKFKIELSHQIEQNSQFTIVR